MGREEREKERRRLLLKRKWGKAMGRTISVMNITFDNLSCCGF